MERPKSLTRRRGRILEEPVFFRVRFEKQALEEAAQVAAASCVPLNALIRKAVADLVERMKQ
jgi:predicted HicB family RNase H-like nuclease